MKSRYYRTLYKDICSYLEEKSNKITVKKDKCFLSKKKIYIYNINSNENIQ